MTPFHLPARLLILAGSFLVAVALAAAVAAFAGRTAGPAPRTVADCTNNQSNGSYSLSCAPGQTTNGNGAPSESDLTADNANRQAAKHSR
jgi:hypothetical protein